MSRSPLQVCREDPRSLSNGIVVWETALRRPAPSSDEVTHPKRGKRRRITLEEAKQGTEGV